MADQTPTPPPAPKMTMKQKALAALLAAATAVGGGTVGAPALQKILSVTCGKSETVAKQLVPGGEETKITLKNAVNILGQYCDEGTTPIVDTVELKIFHPSDGGTAAPREPQAATGGTK